MQAYIENPQEVLKELNDYWKKQFSNLPSQLELPLKNTGLSRDSHSAAIFSFSISKNFVDALHQLGLRCGTTLFMTLLAAFKTLLYRYTNQDDIIVGYPYVEKDGSKNGEEPGTIQNTLLLRTAMSGDLSFIELLQRIREVVSGALVHKTMPFEVLVENLKFERGSIPASLFQIVFSMQESVGDRSPDNEKPAIHTNGKSRLPLADITLSLKNGDNGLEGVWEYNTLLFDSDTIGRMSTHFQVLLEGIVDKPKQKISFLPLLSKKEQHQLIFEWNNTFAEFPCNTCIHELFEQQVKRSPDAIAVALYDVPDKNLPAIKRQLTYHELNKRANQLAHHLQSLGVAPEVLVGLCVERSLEMAIGLLGILKAGGAYLPLDPSYPKERLNFMLTDSRVSVLVTQQSLLQGLPSTEAGVVCLDSDGEALDQYSEENAVSGVASKNLAYVIYTSGSTGIPKGTLINHRGVVNYLSWCIKAYAVADGDGAPVNSSIAFDATVTSFFSPLLAGKAILLLPKEAEIEALCSVLLSNIHFSLVKITPAHLQILSQMLSAGQVEGHTKAFIIGGEALPARSLDLWLTHAPGTRLINEYGPTETVVGCCTYEASHKELMADDIPIGRPIANTQMYILDQNLQPVPIGVTGEIYIGGEGVARGYLNRPELTAGRFLVNPFIAGGHARIYKTGDLGRYLSDGNIVFLGRTDHQVKIRGYRIELGEIEATLRQHPAVQQVVVIAREDYPGNKQLVAYLVLHQENASTPAKLRLFLGEKLPGYMAPSLFIFLKSLPLTPNHKIDRNALPVPELQRPELEKTYLAPRDSVEMKLAKIFEEALRVHPIGVHDNLFDLGINSILAAFIFSRIRRTLGRQLPLSSLLQAPTIEQLAIYFQQENVASPWSSLVPIQPEGTKPPLFCVHGGIGTVLFYRDLANKLGKDQPFYGLQAKGLDGIGVPQGRIVDMAAHYIAEIRSVQPEGPYFLAGYCFGGIVAFEMAKQLTEQGLKIALLANFNAVSPTYTRSPDQIMKMDDIQMDSGIRQPAADELNSMYKPEHLNARGKLVYVLKSLKRKTWDQLKGKLSKKNLGYRMRLLNYKYSLLVKRPLPEAFAKFYLWETNEKMVKDYKPIPYPGRMVIFRSPGIYQDPHLGWTDLVEGGIETIDIPGDHEYPRQIITEPSVLQLAEELKNHLIP